MARWEYYNEGQGPGYGPVDLEGLGLRGWELVAVAEHKTYCNFYFKRRIPLIIYLWRKVCEWFRRKPTSTV